MQFDNIPQTFTDLVILGSIRSTASAAQDNLNISLNGGSSSLLWNSRRVYGTGSGVGNDAFPSFAYMPGIWVSGATSTANTFGNLQIYIPGYTSATNKVISVESVAENNATAGYTGLTIGSWSSTAAINSVTLGVAMTQYCTASLYGITKGSGGATAAQA
jgi:hypothetical protein